MTFRFCDGMDSYAITANINLRWLTVNGASLTTTGGRFGGGAVTNSSSPYALSLSKGISIPSGTKIRTGFSVRYATGATPSGINQAYPVVALNGNQIMGITSAGLVAVTNYGSNTTQILSSIGVVDNNYHWVELEYFPNGASGSAQLYIDGIFQGSVSANLGAAVTVTTIAFGGGYVFNSNVFIDDILVWDDQGASFNSYPLGPRRITTLVPNADGDLTQFTPKTGTFHYLMVNGGYTSGNYVSDGSTGNVELFKYPTLPYTPLDITAVIGNYYGQNSGSGTTNLIPKLKTSSTTVSGATLTLPIGTLTSFQFAFATDAIGSAWTAASVNAMQLGMGD